MADPRIAYGSRCCWWDSIHKVGKTPPGPGGVSIPCCPHCGGVVFEMPDETTWWASVDKYEREARQPGYRKMWEWARGRCYPNVEVMKAAYAANDGRKLQ